MERDREHGCFRARSEKHVYWSSIITVPDIFSLSVVSFLSLKQPSFEKSGTSMVIFG